MKKLFTTLFLTAISAGVFAQVPPPGPSCTPTLTDASQGLLVPDTITDLPTATQGTSYSTVIQAFTPTTIQHPQLGTLNVNSFTVTGVSGLPTEFAYTTNPANGQINGGTAGCIAITSTGNVSSAVGTYALTISLTANVTTPFGPQDVPQSITGYQIVINEASAEVCTPTLTDDSQGNIVPDTITNLPMATYLTPYSTVMQIFASSQINTPLGLLDVDNFTITGVTGLPTEFSYVTNPANGIFAGGQAGCLVVSTNGNNVTTAPGTYPIIVSLSVSVTTPFGPQTVPQDVTGYKIVIDGEVGYITRDVNTFSLVGNYPNPAADYTAIEFGSDANTTVTLNVVNTLGAIVHTQNITAVAGNNLAKVNTSSLTNGTYFFTLNNGSELLSGKFNVVK